MQVTGFSANLGPYRPQVEGAMVEMQAFKLIPRLWDKDHTIWKPDPVEITNRMGWLTVAEHMRDRVVPLSGFARSIADAGFSHVVLLGMGGSSLGPEVLRATFGNTRPFPKLIVLDSTVPGAIKHVAKSIRPNRTLFIVSSKSGDTVEVTTLFSYFWQVVTKTPGNAKGSQFIAITDAGTRLVELAQDRGFRTIFTNPSDIGGRYSVLSYFGLVPAALLGIDLAKLLDRAIAMARSCGPHVPPQENPGACFGAGLGLLALSGRDKVTVVASPKVSAFGLWAEQLLAESSGKEGKGIVPVAQEPLGHPSCYGDDRVFVYLRLDGDDNRRADQHLKILEQAGSPVIRFPLHDRYDLGGEFLRWEFATSVATHYLGVHPFNQPNVQESKKNTQFLLREWQGDRPLPQVSEEKSLESLLEKAEPGKYLAILAYLHPSEQIEVAIAALRQAILRRYRLATTFGYGPRYLHSTGQLHKGGPNSGLFLQLLEDFEPKLKIPEQSYTFGDLAEAQALGDFQSLRGHHRPVMRFRVGAQAAAQIRALTKTLTGGAERPARSKRASERPSSPKRRAKPK